MAISTFFKAALHRNFDLVQQEIDNGVDVNQKYNGVGILHLLPYGSGYSSASGRYTAGSTNETQLDALAEETTQMYGQLISAGVDPNMTDGWGRSALFLPCAFADTNGPRGHKFSSVVDLLLQEDCDPNAGDNWGYTPALAAIASRDVNVVGRVFSDNGGADINLQLSEGAITPLHQAVQIGNIPVIRYLFTRKPDITLRATWRNITAEEIARNAGRDDILEEFEIYVKATPLDSDGDETEPTPTTES